MRVRRLVWGHVPIAPGFYPDPGGKAAIREWTGTEWSPFLRDCPAGRGPATGSGPAPIWSPLPPDAHQAEWDRATSAPAEARWTIIIFLSCAFMLALMTVLAAYADPDPQAPAVVGMLALFTVSCLAPAGVALRNRPALRRIAEAAREASARASAQDLLPADVRGAQPTQRRRVIPLTAAPIILVPALAVTVSVLAHPAASVTMRPVARLTDTGGSRVYSVAFSPDSRTLATGDDNGTTYLWNVGTGQQTGKVTDPGPAGVHSVAFSPNGRTLAAGGKNGTTYLWNVATGHLTAALTDPDGAGLYSVAFSPAGRTLAAGDSNGVNYLWHLAARHLAGALNNPVILGVESLAFSPDGRSQAVACLDGNIYLWDLVTGHLTATLPAGGIDAVDALAFSPDDRRLAATDSSNAVYLWDVVTGRTVVLTGPSTVGFKSVTFSPSGRTLAAGASNGSSYVWDVATGHLAATLTGTDTAGLDSVAFSPNGRTLAAGATDGTASLWNVP